MIDDRFDDVLKETAKGYNEPPETPRSLMWARIEAVRRERAQRRPQLRILYSPWTRFGVGIAAALAIGIGIGRFALAPDAITPIATTSNADALAVDSNIAYRLVAMEHLTQAEAFLTSFRSDPRLGAADERFYDATRGLLSSTRLLLDSPAAEEPAFKTLLEDLELVLVQIAQLSSERGTSETDFVTDGIERRGLLVRLRTTLPAGPVVGMEGAL